MLFHFDFEEMNARSLRNTSTESAQASDSFVLDGLDLEILRLLVSDGRKPFNKLAEELSVSDVTIKMRIKKLSADGILKGFAPIIDYGKLGYDVTSFIELKIVPGTLNQVVDVLERIPQVVELYELHSHCDLLLKVKAKNPEDLRSVIVDRIRHTLNRKLISDDSSAVLRKYKEGSNVPVVLWGTPRPEVKAVDSDLQVKLTDR